MCSPFKTNFNWSVIAHFHSLFDQCATSTLKLFKDRKYFSALFLAEGGKYWCTYVQIYRQNALLSLTLDNTIVVLSTQHLRKKIQDSTFITCILGSSSWCLLYNFVTSYAPLETDHPKFTCLRTVKQKSKSLNSSN